MAAEHRSDDKSLNLEKSSFYLACKTFYELAALISCEFGFSVIFSKNALESQ